MATELHLGTGRIFISCVSRDGVQGLLLRPVYEDHPTNGKDLEWATLAEYFLKDDDVVVWAHSLESARVFQDVLNGMVLAMNGYKVDDKEQGGMSEAQRNEFPQKGTE